MRISEIFNLKKSQAELDFIDIDVTKDTPLFLDPFFLSIRSDNWSLEATRTIRSFFQRVIDLIGAKEILSAKRLFEHLKEPNSTCLGLSIGSPRGRGVGRSDTDDIFNSIINSRAVQTGLLKDLEDNILFVEGFGKDKLSDMTTNIIRSQLIEYTKNQCILHNIPLKDNIPSGFFWNRKSMQWEQEYCDMLIVDGRAILLVPKGVASFSAAYTPLRFYTHFVLNFLQNEHLRINSALVQQRANGTKFVTKKSLKQENPLTKEFLTEFSQRNPNVLKNFKARTFIDPLTNAEITDINSKEVVEHLKSELLALPAGTIDATKYHRLITGILELIFYPHLIYPTLEQEIHDGRKRIDLTFDNAAKKGIFLRFSENLGLPSQYIMVECKNYSSDPKNPELDQLSGRFSPNRGKVGFLLCRSIDNLKLFIKRCQDTYKDDRGLIIPLMDEDIIAILNNYNNWNSNFVDEYLSDRMRLITLN